MSRFDDLRQKVGIEPTNNTSSKPALSSVNLSTRSVTPASELPQPTAASMERPVRPTQMLPQLSYDITQSPLLKEVRQSASGPMEIEDRARQVPYLGAVLRGLDKFAEKSEPVANVLRSFYIPGAGVSEVGALTGVARNLVNDVAEWYAPKLANTIGGKIAKTAATEAIVGAPLGAAGTQILNPDASGTELLKGAGLGAALGGGLGAIGEGGVQGLRALAAKRAARSTDDVIRSVEESNARDLTENDELLKASTEPTTNINQLRDLAKKRKGTLSNPGSSVNVARSNVQDARTELKNIDSQINELSKDYNRAIDEQYQYLKSSANENRGGEKGGLIKDPVTGEVVNRYGTISSKPIWYQEALKEFNTKTLNNTQLRELAKKHIDEGFNDDGGFVPSIKEAIGYDENIVNSLKMAKQEIEQSVKPLTRNSTPEEVVQAIQKPRVRDKVYNFLDEQEAAARKRIAARRNVGFMPSGGNEAVDWTIIGASKLGKGTIKAADWTEAMVKEFGEDFRKHAPKVYQQSKEVLRQQERKASKEGQAADEFNAGGGDASTFEQKINREVNGRKKSFSQMVEQARTQLTDRMAPFEGLEKRVTGGVASAEKSLYKSSRLFAGVSEKANQIITDRLSPIIKGVEDAGYKADDLGRYALAKHAQDVNKAGYISGYTNAEIDDVIRKYKNAPGLEEARQQLIKVNKDMLDSLVDAGVTSPQLRDTLNERWKNYIPLFRSFEDDPETFAAGLGQSLKSIGDPVKVLKGSKRKVIDPLENMVKNIYQSVTAAERNKVKLKLSELSKADPDANYIRKLKDDEAVGKKNIIPVRENGETVRYEVEPEVFKAFAGLDNESSNMLMNVLAAPASILRAGATLTPDFALRNPIRDVAQAFVTSKSGFNPVVDFPIGLYQTITKGKYYKDWIDNLGAYGNTLSMDRNMHKEALQKVLKEPAGKKFVNVITGKSLVKLLRSISDTTESATKVGEYRKALKKGVTPQEAAYRARDLMDFARAGTSIKPANRIISFLNANIQGKSKLLRAIKERPAPTITKMFTGVTLPTLGIYAWNHNQANETQRQTMDEAPNWQKDAFWMIAVPGTDLVARIPKPFDIAPLFANLPERVLDRIFRSNPVEMGEWIRNSLTESALPTQISGLLPLIEGMSGYSFFRQGNVVPEREKGLELKDQYDPVRTSEVAKLLASGVRGATGEEGSFKNFGSPRIMDNTIKGLTAGLGTYATDAIDSILKGPTIPFTGGKKLYPPLIDRPAPPEKRLEQAPLARSFLVDKLGSTESMDKMYNQLDKLTKEESSRQLRGEEPTRIGKKTVYLDPEKATQLTTLQSVSKEISDINKEIRAIEADKVKSAKQKRDELEPLLAQRNKLSIEVMRNQKR